MVLGLEDSGARMSRLGKSELVHEQALSPEQVLDRIRAVTPEQVREVARDVLSRPRSLAVLGPYGGADLQEAIA